MIDILLTDYFSSFLPSTLFYAYGLRLVRMEEWIFHALFIFFILLYEGGDLYGKYKTA